MDYLVSFFSSFWSAFRSALSWLLDGVLYVIQAVLYFIFDGLLTTVYAIVGALDVGTFLTSFAGYWSGLSPQLIYAVNACGIGSGISIIVYAIGIRMLLNLIPASFTRI